MKYLKKYLIVIIIFSLSTKSAKSQSNDECKYLMVLTYLRTNEQINEHLKGMFFRHKKSKKSKFVEFNLNNQIEFIGIGHFRDSLNSRDYGISKELVNDNKLYRDSFYFERFRLQFLDKLIEPNPSSLYLTFSKSVGNILVAAIGNMDPKLYGVNQWGLGLTMLFKFDSLGLIENVFYYGAAYR